MSSGTGAILAKGLAEYAPRSVPISGGGGSTREPGGRGFRLGAGLGCFNKGEKEERIRQEGGHDQVRGEEVIIGRGEGLWSLKGGRTIEYRNGLRRGQRGVSRVVRKMRQGKGGESGTG